MSLTRYAGFVLAVVAGSLGLVWLGLGSRLTRAGLLAVVLGGLIASANTLAAYGLVRWAEKRSANAFMAAVLGGMVGRMGLMLAVVVGAVLVLGVPKLPLAFSLLSYFVFFLVFELAVLQKQRPGALEARS